METSDKIDEGISGNVIITDGQIIWTRNDKIISQIPLDKVKLIGEYTTSGGPVNDDWFIVFMTAKDT